MAGKLAAQIPPAQIGDNSAHAEESERAQLISVIRQVEKANEKCEAAKAEHAAANKSRTTIFRLAKAAGFTREELEARMKEMNESSSDVAIRTTREAKHRKWLGILTDEQMEMFASENTPAEAKDEYHFNSEGYKAGLRGQTPKPPPEVPERFVQSWMTGYHSGEETSKASIAANAPKPLGERVKAATAAEKAKAVAEKAAADFKADNPPQTAEIPDPDDVEAAAKRLKASQFMAGAPKPSGVNLAK